MINPYIEWSLVVKIKGGGNEIGREENRSQAYQGHGAGVGEGRKLSATLTSP